MSKFTSKDLMNAMGLKVGDKILFGSETTYEIICNELFDANILSLRDINTEKHYELSDVVDCYYTILPRYTLTEDEKAIVRCLIDYGCGYIKRTKYNSLVVGDKTVFHDTINPFNHQFDFLKQGDEVSLDELRKCL